MDKAELEAPASPEIEPEQVDEKVKPYCFGDRMRIPKPEHRERGSIRGFRVSESFLHPDGSNSDSEKEEIENETDPDR